MAESFDGFSAPDPTDPVQIGPYRPVARLGAGGMGRVYLSALPGGRPIALKVVHEAYASDPDFRRRFALEAQAAQQVNGIHIAQLLDVGADAPVPWLATAYIPGPSLLEAVRQHGPLPAGAVRVLGAATARAIDAVHQAGLIHRDLKPANVILAEDGPRVIDFGVARAADSTTAGLTRGRIGSAQYMAPEQVRGLAATPALDVFAVGALMFFAATGRPAFGEGEDLAVIFRIVQEEPDLSGCPTVVRDLVAACLNKDPVKRPDVAAIIRYCEGDAPLQAGPGWLPDGVAQMARTRAESSAALIAGQTKVGPVPLPALAPETLDATLPYVQTPAPPQKSWITAKLVALVAGVAVVSAAIAVGAVLLTKSSPSRGGGQALGTNNSTAGQKTHSSQPSGASSGRASQTSTSGSDPIAWQGTASVGHRGVTIGSSGLAAPGQDIMFEIPEVLLGGYPFLSEVGYPAGSDLARWTGSGPPSRQDCLTALAANGTMQVYIPSGGEFCAEGAGKQVAAVKVVSVDSQAGIATLKVVVWSQPAS